MTSNANSNVRQGAPRDARAPIGHGAAEAIATTPGRDAATHHAVGHADRGGAATDHRPPTGHSSRGRGVGHADQRGVVTDAERDRLAAGFGRRLAELRAAKGWTQTQASGRAQVTQGYWSHLEHGRRRPSADLVALLALVLADGDPWAVLDELLSLGGDALSGSGRRRFRKAARVALAARMAEPKVRAETARTLRRTLALADRLEAAGAVEQAASIRAATERIGLHADGAPTEHPLTSADSGRAGSVRTPRRPGGGAR